MTSLSGEREIDRGRRKERIDIKTDGKVGEKPFPVACMVSLSLSFPSYFKDNREPVTTRMRNTDTPRTSSFLFILLLLLIVSHS